MYVCDYGYSSDIYQDELNKILEGDDEVSTTKYGFTKMTPNYWCHSFLISLRIKFVYFIYFC